MDTELADALAAASGSWAIIRKGRRNSPPRVRRFRQAIGESATALRAWHRLDVREGWAKLVSPIGTICATKSGPWGVRSRW